ncbi:hypothetical protein SAMN05216481_104159 [Streptomyces radiopugnans]|uniref:Uncharacterized protein n=1 Tax=Streptomyces radiopugnans TaxID=403935 RepID=A0A1H9DKZ9_9ACTN|nr:hypothetical protein SAMN05216481_104159 [Streptomyces radiopugnans]
MREGADDLSCEEDRMPAHRATRERTEARGRASWPSLVLFTALAFAAALNLSIWQAQT